MKMLRTRALLTVCCLCLQPVMAAGTGTAPSLKMKNLSLADVAAAGGGLIAVGERGLVMRSPDSGLTWNATNTPTTRMLTGVAFVDALTGVAVGHGGTLMRTVDGGTTWTETKAAIKKDAVLGVTLRKNGHLIAFGAFGMYLESVDKGATWERKKVVSEEFDRHISKVIEVGDRLLLVGESGTLAYSDDQGSTWTTVASPYVGSYFGALLLGDGGVLIFGMRGNVYRSSDAGLTWKKVGFASTSTLNGGTVGPSGQIALVGNNGLIAISHDHGKTFSLNAAPQGTPIAQAAYAADGALVYVGYLTSGRVPERSAAPVRTPATPLKSKS